MYTPQFESIFCAIFSKFCTPEACKIWDPKERQELTSLAYKTAMDVEGFAILEAQKYQIPPQHIYDALQVAAARIGMMVVPVPKAETYQTTPEGVRVEQVTSYEDPKPI